MRLLRWCSHKPRYASSPRIGKRQGRFSLRLSGGSVALSTLILSQRSDFRLLASGTARECIFVVLSHSMIISYSSHRKLIEVPSGLKCISCDLCCRWHLSRAPFLLVKYYQAKKKLFLHYWKVTPEKLECERHRKRAIYFTIHLFNKPSLSSCYVLVFVLDPGLKLNKAGSLFLRRSVDEEK